MLKFQLIKIEPLPKLHVIKMLHAKSTITHTVILDLCLIHHELNYIGITRYNIQNIKLFISGTNSIVKTYHSLCIRII